MPIIRDPDALPGSDLIEAAPRELSAFLDRVEAAIAARKNARESCGQERGEGIDEMTS